MDSMEKSHALQSSVVSSLFNARQLIWTELSSVISGIQEQFDHANKERNGEFDRLLTENRSLTDVLNRLNEIVEGKEIEIQGLRRQLQSFYTSRPICSSCSRDISLSDKVATAKEHGRTVDKPSPRRTRTYLPYFTEQAEVRKRLRSNTSLSSASPVSATIGRGFEPTFGSRWETKPAHKRQCTRESTGHVPSFPIVLVRDTQALEEEDDFYEKPTRRGTASPVASGQKKSTKLESFETKKKPPVTPKDRAFRMTEFSPPTQQFDASLAIENAVNHSDLAAGEVTRLDSIASTATYVQDTGDEQESITLSLDTQQRETSKFVFRRHPTTKSRSRVVASQLLHRRLGIGFGHQKSHRTIRSKQRQARHSRKRDNRKNADETSTDISLPSDFLESERSMLIPTVKPMTDSDISPPMPKLRKETMPSSDKHLPSLGGSPTSQEQQVFKRPRAPAPHSMWSPKPKYSVKNQTALPEVDDLETQLPSQPVEHPIVSSTAETHKTGFDACTSNDSPLCLEDKENQISAEPRVALQHLDSESLGKQCEVKYVGPVERCKEIRRQLTGHSCASCKEYYTSMGLSSPEIANRIHRCSRHRALHGPPPSTPKGFWNIDIPDSECPIKTEESGTEQAKRSRRRRPLNFPSNVRVSTDCTRSPRLDTHLRDAGNQVTSSPR